MNLFSSSSSNRRQSSKRPKCPPVLLVLFSVCAIAVIVLQWKIAIDGLSTSSHQYATILREQFQFLSPVEGNTQLYNKKKDYKHQNKNKEKDIETSATAAAKESTMESVPADQQQVVNDDGNSNVAANRTIVILWGNMRCGEKAWETLYRNLLDINQADLGLIMGYTRPEYENGTLWKRAKYVWRFDEYDDWADAVDQVSPNWQTTVKPKITGKVVGNGMLGGVNGAGGSGAIQGMIKYWLSQHILEEGLLDKYDYFVITRTDQYYSCPFRLSELSNLDTSVIVPLGEDFSGICDRFYVTGKNQIMASLDLLPQLLNNYNPMAYRAVTNIESFLKASWRRKGLRVQRCKRTMFTCAATGDQTRWALILEDNRYDEGVISKYPYEYNQTKRTCKGLE